MGWGALLCGRSIINHLTAFHCRPTGFARCSSRKPRNVRKLPDHSHALTLSVTGLCVYGQSTHATKQTTTEKHRKPRYVPSACCALTAATSLMHCIGASVGEQHRRI